MNLLFIPNNLAKLVSVTYDRERPTIVALDLYCDISDASNLVICYIS